MISSIIFHIGERPRITSEGIVVINHRNDNTKNILKQSEMNSKESSNIKEWSILVAFQVLTNK